MDEISTRKIKAVVLYSGGLDSTVLLYYLRKTDAVKALAIDYGQRHVKELEAALTICMETLTPFDRIDLSALNPYIAMGSQAGRDPVPEGHYAAEMMKATVVPNRNMMMISIAAAHAIKLGARDVYTAVHAGDHDIYPDCRREFIYSLNHSLVLANEWTPIHLFAPFVGLTKAEIVHEGAELGVPFELTWSCYAGGDLHCGKCGTCVERQEAFYIAGVKDPTIYA